MIIEPYRDLVKSYQIYWRLYGGWPALLSSPYFHAAVIITICCAPFWASDDGAKTWSAAALDILPNLMGFSIAGMSVFLAFSNPETMKAITEEGDAKSFYAVTVAMFFHFIFVQTIALLLGFIGQYIICIGLTALGVLFLSYAILAGLAMAMSLLQTARIVNAASALCQSQSQNSPKTKEDTL